MSAYKRLKKVTTVPARVTGAHQAQKNKVIDFYQPIQFDQKEILSDMFNDMEFYIVNVDDKYASKHRLEKIIAENGGFTTQNLRSTTTHIVAARVTA